MNIFTGFIVSELGKEGESTVIFYIGICLAAVLATKIILSLTHVVVTFFHSKKTAESIKYKTSTIFKNVVHEIKETKSIFIAISF